MLQSRGMVLYNGIFSACFNFSPVEVFHLFRLGGKYNPFKGNVAVYKGLFLELPSCHVIVITTHTHS